MILFAEKAWDDFFSDQFDSRVQQSTRYVASSGKNYVYDCRFCFVEYKSGNGGTICFQTSSTNAKLLVEKSSILNCRASGQGGGIHFSSSGQCVLSKVCSFNCSSTGSNNQFDYVYVASNKDYLNDINDSSISYSTSNANSYATLHYYGTIRIISTNYSSNNCKQDPVIHSMPFPDSSIATGIFSFSSF